MLTDFTVYCDFINISFHAELNKLQLSVILSAFLAQYLLAVNLISYAYGLFSSTFQ